MVTEWFVPASRHLEKRAGRKECTIHSSLPIVMEFRETVGSGWPRGVGIYTNPRIPGKCRLRRYENADEGTSAG
jgi:hypothetical protein